MWWVYVNLKNIIFYSLIYFWREKKNSKEEHTVIDETMRWELKTFVLVSPSFRVLGFAELRFPFIFPGSDQKSRHSS